MLPGSWRLWMLLCAVALVLAQGVSEAQPSRTRRPRDISQFRKQHDERRTRFETALEKLAKECDAQGLDVVAGQIRQLAEPVDKAELRMAPLPREVQSDIPADLPDEERHWRTQLRSQRRSLANDLYLIARQALNNGHLGYAYDLIREVAANDPDHISARRVLGYV